MSTILDTHKLIVGTTGAGKTTTARGELGQLLDQRRHLVVLDPMDVYWGERSNAAGTGPGHDIPIFGGRHGDVAITAADGDAIAKIIIEQQISAIVSVKHFQDEYAQRAFALAFLRRLRTKPPGNFHLVIDEAEEFCPQTPPDDVAFELARLIGWFTKRGRSEGFVVTLITQRPADIAKAVISLCQTLIVHRLIAPLDQTAIDNYVKRFADKALRQEIMGSLAGLKTGERWIYTPELNLLERGFSAPIATYDSSRTPAPGETIVEPKLLSQVDMTAIAAMLARPSAVPKDPQQAFDAGTEAGLALLERDRRIAELEEKNAQLVEDGVGYIAAIDRAMDILRDALVGKPAAALLPDANLHSHDAVSAPSLATAKRGMAAEVAPSAAKPAIRRKPRTDATGGDLNAAAITLAGLLKGLSPNGVAWTDLFILGGFRPDSGWIRKSRNQLAEQRLVAGGPGMAIATAELLNSPIQEIRTPSPAEVRAIWREKLRGPGGAIETWLAERGPATRQEIAAGVAMSATAGWFRKGVKDVLGSNLARELGDGRLEAHPLLTGDPK